MPLGTGTGVEQDTGDRQIKGAAGTFIHGVRSQALRPLAQSIDAANVEMAPTAMEGDVESWIGLADDLLYVRSGFFQTIDIVGEVRQPARLRQRQ